MEMEIKLNKLPVKHLSKTTYKYTGGVAKVKNSNVDHPKVKVQFIDHNQQLPNKGNLEKDFDSMSPDESIETVEYLDEEFAQVETLTNSDDVHRETEKNGAEAAFYRNAMYCLISTYHEKYQEMEGKNVEQIRAMNVWEEIASIMQESYFNFDAGQVEREFKQIRSKYFNMASALEIDSFEYFDQLHELYQDPVIDSIATGEPRSEDMQPSTLQANYPDECLMHERKQHKLNNDISKKSNPKDGLVTIAEQREIMHKEHEFIDMMEKELQELDGGCIEATTSTDVTHAEQPSSAANASVILLSSSDEQSETQSQSTRKRSTEIFSSKRMKLDSSVDAKGSFKQGAVPPAALESDTSIRDITLADYNTHQERRHQEKMQLFRQYITQQERALKMQQLLIEQLIKRTQ